MLLMMMMMMMMMTTKMYGLGADCVGKKKLCAVLAKHKR
jgi:hypothetical protein